VGEKARERGTNDVAELLFASQVVEERLRDDGAEEGELRAEVVVVEVADIGELLD
jgi:hypothetical protein